MAKMTTKEQLAADLERRGGPKNPSEAERIRITKKVQAHKGPDIMYNDKQVIERGAKPVTSRQTPIVNSPSVRSSGSVGRAPIVPQAPVSGLRPPMGPQMEPSNGQLNRTFLPMAMNGPRPPMGQPPAPPTPYRPPMSQSRPPQGQSPMVQLINILSQLSSGWDDSDWGSGQRATDDPRTWMPDLWSLSGLR